MEDNEAHRKLAALKAIVQMPILEQYWEEDEMEGKLRFSDLVEADHPVAIAIVNELIREGLEAAFRWPNRTHMGTEKEIPARPMVAFLSPRARALLEHEDWTARTKPPGGGTGLGAPARRGVHVYEGWRKPSSKAENGVTAARSRIPRPGGARRHRRIRAPVMRLGKGNAAGGTPLRIAQGAFCGR